MVEKSIILEIEKLLDNKKIIDSKLLSDSFGINCLKIITNDSKEFIVKYYYKNNHKFNAIKSEKDNLVFFNRQKFNYMLITYVFSKLVRVICFFKMSQGVFLLYFSS